MEVRIWENVPLLSLKRRLATWRVMYLSLCFLWCCCSYPNLLRMFARTMAWSEPQGILVLPSMFRMIFSKVWHEMWPSAGTWSTQMEHNARFGAQKDQNWFGLILPIGALLRVDCASLLPLWAQLSKSPCGPYMGTHCRWYANILSSNGKFLSRKCPSANCDAIVIAQSEGDTSKRFILNCANW